MFDFRSHKAVFASIALVFFVLVFAGVASAAKFAASRGPLPGAGDPQPFARVQILLSGTGGQGTYSTTTDPSGAFRFTGVPSGTYRVATQSTAYYAHAQIVVVASEQTTAVHLRAIRSIAAVVVSAPRRLAPTKEDLYRTSQTQVALDENIIKSQAPLAGSEQLLAAAPGVMQASYGSTGAAKGMISLRGFKQGWANNAGVVDNGLLGVTLNGVYLNNPQTGIWEPDEVPDLSIISGANVTYGPGEAASRTFDSLGGTVDFFTILPSKTSSFRSSATAGSFGGRGYHFDYSKSLSNHWGMLIAQGRTFSQGFRDIIGSGTAGPGSTYGTFAEFQNLFSRGSLLFFGYAANATYYRPNLFPVTPLHGPNGQVVTVNGFDTSGNPIPGPAYSQATTGYYSALPLDAWQKTDANSTRLLGVDLTYNTGRAQYVTNQAWFRHGDRLHVKQFNFDSEDNTSRFEYNNPFSNALGDTLAYHVVRGDNDYQAGFNLLYSRYNTRNSYYNPTPIGPNPGPPTSIDQPSTFRNNDFWMSDIAFFAQDDVRIGQRAEFIPGVRTVGMNTSFVNNGLVGFPLCADPSSPCYGNNHTNQPNSTTSYHSIEPSFAARYALAEHVAAYASYARGMRNPPTSPGGPYQRVSVIGLLPEFADDTEAGLKFYQPLVGRNLDGSDRANSATLGFFDSTLENQTIPITIGQTKYSSASGTSHYAGLTFAFDADMRRDLQMFGSYSITHAAFINYITGGVSYSGLPVPETPINTANLGLVADFPQGPNLVTGRLWDQFVGNQPMWNNQLGMPDPNGAMIPSYDLVNGSVAYRFGPKSRPISFSLTATNLLNRKYNSFEYISAGAYFAGGDAQSVPYGAGQLLADPGPPREIQFTVSVGQ